MAKTSRSRHRDLRRLVTAVSLFVRQQWERSLLGGGDELEEVADDNARVAREVIAILERSLDEDLVERLDDEGEHGSVLADLLTWPFAGVPRGWPVWPALLGPRARRGAAHATKLDRAVDDFADEVHEACRKARRERRPVDERDLRASLDSLLEDLHRSEERPRASAPAAPAL